MSNAELVPVNNYALSPTEYALLEGDLSQLSNNDRLNLYNAVCASVGLNPLTCPFEYIRLNNKLKMYAKKDCTDQLREIKKVSIVDLTEREINGVYIVTAKAQDKHGRTDVSKGAVFLGTLQGEALANAIMKAETKAKRRVTLSICGLGMLDESETGNIPGAEIVPHSPILNTQVLPAEDPLTSRRSLAVKTWKKFFTPDALTNCLPELAIMRDGTGKILVGSTFAQLLEDQLEAVEEYMANPTTSQPEGDAKGAESFPGTTAEGGTDAPGE